MCDHGGLEGLGVVLLLDVQTLELLLDLLWTVVLEREELGAKVRGGFMDGGRLGGAIEEVVPWQCWCHSMTLSGHLNL